MRELRFPEIGEVCWEHWLSGGLRIRVIPKPDFAKTYAFLAADYGAIDTAFFLDGVRHVTPDGIAHYLEHKMFDMPQGNVMQEFTRLGGSPNAFTGYGMTAYYVECADHWRENLELLLRFVTTPYFTDESVEKERGIISQEIGMYEDNPDSKMYENLFSALYAHHPIRVPIAGTVESIQAITASTLESCYRAFYDLANMMLCVAGPVEPEAVAEIADRVVPSSRGIRPERDYGPPEALDGQLRRVRTRMEVAMTGFTVGFKCAPPADGTDSLRRELLGDLAAELLVGESTALYSRLYEQGLIESDFSAGYEAVRGAAMVTAGGDSPDPERVCEAILEEAARIGREGADPKLFEQLKRSAFGRRMRELDSFENICYRMCQSCFEGGEYCEFPALYRSITQEETERLIRDAVRPERAAVSVIDPKEKA